MIVERIASTDTGVNAFGLHPETGEILTVSFENGFIGRLVPAPDPEVLPPTLSATGVFADVATLTPAAGVLPYEVAARSGRTSRSRAVGFSCLRAAPFREPTPTSGPFRPARSGSSTSIFPSSATALRPAGLRPASSSRRMRAATV